ncbi:hypothetical protein SLE2022_014330 [Rubroshorea leprosula]
MEVSWSAWPRKQLGRLQRVSQGANFLDGEYISPVWENFFPRVISLGPKKIDLLRAWILRFICNSIN